MAKRAIILRALADGAGQQIEIRVALWATVPAERQPFYANAEATSAYRLADAGELVAIQSGSIAERVETIRRDPGTSAAQIRTAVEQAWAAWQAEVIAYNPWSRYGSSYNADGSWTNAGVS